MAARWYSCERSVLSRRCRMLRFVFGSWWSMFSVMWRRMAPSLMGTNPEGDELSTLFGPQDSGNQMLQLLPGHRGRSRGLGVLETLGFRSEGRDPTGRHRHGHSLTVMTTQAFDRISFGGKTTRWRTCFIPWVRLPLPWRVDRVENGPWSPPGRSGSV